MESDINTNSFCANCGETINDKEFSCSYCEIATESSLIDSSIYGKDNSRVDHWNISSEFQPSIQSRLGTFGIVEGNNKYHYNKTIIHRYCNLLMLPTATESIALEYYSSLSSKYPELVITNAILSACIWLAVKSTNKYFTLGQISNILSCKPRSMLNASLFVKNSLCISIESSHDSCSFLDIFHNKLTLYLDTETVNSDSFFQPRSLVIEKSRKLVNFFMESGIFDGMNPFNITLAAILLVSHPTPKLSIRSIKIYSECLGLNHEVVRRRIKDFQTMISSLLNSHTSFPILDLKSLGIGTLMNTFFASEELWNINRLVSLYKLHLEEFKQREYSIKREKIKMAKQFLDHNITQNVDVIDVNIRQLVMHGVSEDTIMNLPMNCLRDFRSIKELSINNQIDL